MGGVGGRVRGGLEIREIECFLVLAEELHFGRAAERLYVSQGRVSQLLAALERRVGGTLLERTSRRVRLTPLGQGFLDDLRPAYGGLREAVDRARAAARGVEGVLRVGFVGSLGERLTRAFAEFGERHPGCEMEVVELPMSDPFGALHRGAVDAAIVLTPVQEARLVVGPVFSREPLTLVVSERHPFAGRGSLTAEELASCRLIGVSEPAPRYWRDAQSPPATPGGVPIPRGPVVGTFQEGLMSAAAGHGALLVCDATARAMDRGDVARVPVTGLPDSALTLVWPRDGETARVRAFSEVVARRAALGDGPEGEFVAHRL